MSFSSRFRIKTNLLLNGTEKTISLDEALELKRLFSVVRSTDTVKDSPGNFAANMSSVSDEQLKEVYSVYGADGLFRLVTLAYSQRIEEFNFFFKLIEEDLNFSRISLTHEQFELECDNDKLLQCERLEKFNANVILPSLSRKLYNPGSHHGYLVYGLGGPKILVSHPFQGINGESYDVYHNSVDVVTSLILRGYDGRFLFLDNLPGLNFEIHKVPAWLLWFSLVAAHSDLILFVKEYKEEFGPSQRSEIQFTPDRVQKKLVEIPHDELTWATKPESSDVDRTLYFTGTRGSTKEDFYKIEAEVAEPLIKSYATPGYAKDRIIRIDGSDVTEYPLDYPMYGLADG